MEYRFFHPDNARIEFVYDSDRPMLIEKRFESRTERITLVHKNVNAEDFFFCLITSKCVHIEDRYQGYAFLDGKKFLISRPYDCKWIVHTLLEISKENPLIISDRQEKRYIWPFSDEDMSGSRENEGSSNDLFPPEFAQQFRARKRAFQEKDKIFEEDFSSRKKRTSEAFSQFQKTTWNDFSEMKPGPLAQAQTEKKEKAASFAKKRERVEKEIKNFSDETGLDSFDETLKKMLEKVERFRDGKKS